MREPPCLHSNRGHITKVLGRPGEWKTLGDSRRKHHTRALPTVCPICGHAVIQPQNGSAGLYNTHVNNFISNFTYLQTQLQRVTFLLCISVSTASLTCIYRFLFSSVQRLTSAVWHQLPCAAVSTDTWISGVTHNAATAPWSYSAGYMSHGSLTVNQHPKYLNRHGTEAPKCNSAIIN